ncbi:MAG TPA: hypothetical protein VFB06_11380 [Streptosporangiaceae bacterium]|nr:hypothetical protein [Streptosporangiaceae bacterium]
MSTALAATAGSPVGVPTDPVSFPGGTNLAASVPSLTPTFTSGTAAQLSDLTRDYECYIQIGTGGGTVTVAMGPTATPTITLANAAAGVNGEVIRVRLPAGWFLKITVATSTIAGVTCVGC